MDKIMAELPKGPLDKLVISLWEYQGHPFVDLRIQFLGDDDQWHSTKQGIRVSPSPWNDFMTALGQVEGQLPQDDRPRRPVRGKAR
jgi:hypothetical protein